jgi:hypothetical protein
MRRLGVIAVALVRFSPTSLWVEKSTIGYDRRNSAPESHCNCVGNEVMKAAASAIKTSLC